MGIEEEEIGQILSWSDGWSDVSPMFAVIRGPIDKIVVLFSRVVGDRSFDPADSRREQFHTPEMFFHIFLRRGFSTSSDIVEIPSKPI